MCLAVHLDDSNILASCLALLAGNFSRSMLESLIVLETHSSPLRKNQNMSLCNILAVSAGYFARLIYAWTALYHSSPLISSCLKLVKRSNLALTSLIWGLQNFTNLFHIISKHNSSWGKHHDTYWSIPKSPDQAKTLLEFIASDSTASSQSSIFSHLIFHFWNLWYKLSFTVQSIFGPSMYGIYICCIACAWLVEGLNCGLCNTDILESACNSFSLVLSTWLDFLAALDILRFWLQCLQNSFNHI